jgi:hypothetical protein
MMLRAGHWYGQIEPTALSGMDDAKLRRRAADIERLTGESQPFASERELASQDESEADSATPSDLASLFNRGLTAALKEHNFEQAERFFGRCVDLDSEHIPSLNNNALASLRCANSRRAIHMFRQAIDRAPQTRAVAHNLALISRLASKGRASMDSSTRGEIESLLAIAGEDSTYRIANGFVYMAYDDEGDVARDLVDCTCLYCNGVGRVDCPLRGCTRGTVASTRGDISGRDPVTGRTFVKVRPIRVPCSRCGGRGMVDCPHCRSGVMSRLD